MSQIEYFTEVKDNPPEHLKGWVTCLLKIYDWIKTGQGLDVGAGNITISPTTLRADICEYPGQHYCCDAADLRDRNGNKLPDRFVDWVFSSHCLEHTANPLAVLIEWCRVAQKFVVVYVPNGTAWDNLSLEEFERHMKLTGHKQNFHLDELINLVRQIPNVHLQECGYDSVGQGNIYLVIRKNNW